MAAVSQNTLEIILRVRDEATAKLKALESQLSSQSKRLEGYGKRMQGIGKTMMRSFTLPFAAAGGAAVKFGLDFSRALEYANTMMKLSGDELEKFKKGILDISNTYGKSATSIATSAYQVSSVLHTSAQDTLKILDAFSAVAKAGKMSVEEATGAMIPLMSAFGIKAEDTMKVAEKMANVIERGNASWRDLAQYLAPIASSAVAAGASLDELGAAYAVLTSKMGNSARAAFSLQALMYSMVKPTDDMKKAIQALGYSSVQAAIQHEGFANVLVTLLQKYGKNSEALGKLFGERMAMNAAVLLASQNGQEYLKVLDKVTHGEGELARQIEKGRGTAERFSEAMNRLRNAGIQLFTMIEPYLTKFIGYLTKLIERFSKASGATKAFILVAGGILTIAGPIIYFLGKVFVGLSKLPKVLLLARKGLLLFRSALTLTFSHPILLLVYAIAAAFMYVFVKLKELKDIVGSWKDAWTLALLSIRETVIKWAIKVLEVADKVTRAFGRLNRAVKNKLNDLRNDLKQTQNDFYSVATYSQHAGKKEEEFGDITQQVKEDVNALNSELGNLVDSLPDVGDSADNAGKAIEDAFNNAVDAVKSVREEIKGLVNEIADAYSNYQRDRTKEEESYHENVADLVAKTELEIQDLIKKRNEALVKADRDEVDNLNAQISQKQQILQTYYRMQLDLEDEIAERKQYYQMNELEQLSYNHQKKMLMMQKEFLTEQVERMKRLAQLLQEQAEIRKAIGETKMAAVNAEIEKTKTLREQAKERLGIVKNWKEQVVNTYNSMVAEINNMMSSIRLPLPFGIGGRGFQMGTAYVPATGTYVLHKGEAVVPAYRAKKELGKSLNVIVNVNGGYYLSDDAAEELGDKIVKKLKKTIRI